MSHLYFSPSSAHDLIGFFDHIARDNQRAAVEFVNKIKVVAKNNIHLAIRDGESGRLTVTNVFFVIPANRHDLSVTTEHENTSEAWCHGRAARLVRAL